MSGPQFIYHMHRLSKIVPPKREILKNINLSFYPGAKIGVVGPNGSGKSSLLRIMAGLDTDFLGEAWAAKGTRIGYLSQEPELDASLDVRGNVDLAVAETRNLLKRFEEVNLKFGEDMTDDEMTALIDEQAKLQDRIDAAGAWELDRHVEIAMDALRLPPGDADVTTLSGGEIRRVALCRVLLEQPDMLLLDEPTNHLDAESVAWLEHHLAAFSGTIVAITHDRYFLDNVAQWILELDRGQGIPWEGNYTSWLEQKQERLRIEEKQESARQRTLGRELDWIRMSPKARHAKGKARVSAYEDLLSADEREQVKTAEILIPKGPRLGKTVITADAVTKAFGDTLLVDKLSFDVPAGAIVGIIGANGAGKTTLFRMIVGQEQPDAGAMELGQTVELAYVDQSRDALDPDKTVFEEVSQGADILYFGRAEVNSRAYLSWFNFRGADQQKKVGVLSGGERNRLHLAKLLKEGGNVMLLDEPTNDLDVDTLMALENAILDFAGCVLVISHDRWFLDRVATHILAFEGDSKVTWFEGNHSEYEDDRRARLGADAIQPHRIKYRKLVRD
ncbi:MAG: energy-dependent translational throttle protein EttA [Gemmatimonadales bacterium]|jgi:energy-dependent translational throttle protein EttA|nr:energy-dependent translational throttle protein EttA [Gemmatimonadales bacterium]MDG2239615.1 energy-dependent translational throttle protein EttA [Longimicrobiales bacterium]NCG32530.1 energy-dependent translational throttle protein EttA [Pseudomonadota bacterium]MBT3500279.1 energy-dependent translational throttle protein EttA [Gemmatimonadales bacterium]MBT3773429.1 energy-dependent translational throttle protein EttA [Gemmatimonadales bacterium]